MRTNTDSARARAADAEGKTLSWLAEQAWFDRQAFTKFSMRVGAQFRLGLWPPDSQVFEPGPVSLTLHRITDDELCILMTLQEEATYQQVERVLLQLANGEPPEADFTIDSYRPWTYSQK